MGLEGRLARLEGQVGAPHHRTADDLLDLLDSGRPLVDLLRQLAAESGEVPTPDLLARARALDAERERLRAKGVL